MALTRTRDAGYAYGMQRPPFPEWATQEIARLRFEADALQHALDLYLASGGQTAGHNGNASQNRDAANVRQKASRVSKYEAAFAAFERANRPLSLDEMIEIARNAGIDVSRANLRSMIHVQKRAGRTNPLGDRYVWGAQLQTKTAPSEQEETVSKLGGG